MTTRGRFFIVNAGPGDPDNITLKGYRLLRQADVVVASPGQRKRYADELRGKEVLDSGHGLFTELALRRLGKEAVEAQQDTLRSRLEAAYALGLTIVLIESGDIALFSPYRGYLAAFAHLDPQLVPGVSSFNAANALLAQPLLDEKTQRLQMSGLDALFAADPDNLPDTWVLFCMGLDLPALIERIQVLYSPDTDVAFVINAGYADHEVVRSRVADLDRYRDKAIAFPYCIIYIGA